MVSDGDAKVHACLLKLKPYGDVLVKKEECLNHVSKRMGTALRNIRTDLSKKGQRIGGIGFGKLTDAKITKLTQYYGRAIRASKGLTVDEMRCNIQGTLFHCLSTDREPQHTKCPKGEGSWCFYNRALAKSQTPDSHLKMVGTALSQDVGKLIYPVYLRLTETHLLEKCLQGLNQNRNESLHSCIWCRLPKERFFTLFRLNHGVDQSVIQFNGGMNSIKQQVDSLGWGAGYFTNIMRSKKDHARVFASAHKQTIESIRRVNARKAASLNVERLAGQKELQYGAGIA